MPQEDRVYTLDDGSDKAKYLDKYLKEEGYNPKVVGVNKAFNLTETMKGLNPNDGYKIFLYYTYDDLRQDNERLREEIKGLETRGWRNLIVLPFEGMDDQTMDKRITKAVDMDLDKIVGAKWVDPDTEMKENNPVKSELDVASIDQDMQQLEGEFDFDPDKVKRYKVTDKEVKEVKNDTKKGRKRELSNVQDEQEGSVST